MKHIAATIISKNYLAFARTLAKSWHEHHPGTDFFVFLADRNDGYLDELADRNLFTIVPIEEVGIPGIGSFIYRYSVIELNTAVKPYVLEYLLRKHSADTVFYIDPDIWIFRRFEEVFCALETQDIVLIPHMRAPFYDERQPTELNIIQSGTYNLGFIGLRAGPEALRLLQWWQERLFADCVVDIARGLFTDQKWMDLVPAYYERTHLLRDPGYNIAYWNMHERELRASGSHYFVDDRPLTFIHFSGYNPFNPLRLSKYQDRHNLCDMPAVRKISAEYRDALLANGHRESAGFPYSFATLPNGVRLPLRIVRNVMQDFYHRKLPIPDPLEEPDAFCAFLTCPNVGESKAPPLWEHLLKVRPDLAAAFPNALNDPKDPNFRKWLTVAGPTEEGTGELVEWAARGGKDTRAHNLAAEVFDTLEMYEREDVFAAFPNMWFNSRQFDLFAAWVGSFNDNPEKWVFEFGDREGRFTTAHAESLRRAFRSFFQIVALYFMRGDLQVEFDVLGNREVQRKLKDWLLLNRNEFGINLAKDDINLFSAFLAHNRNFIERARFLYQHYGNSEKNSVSIYTLNSRRNEVRTLLSKQEIAEWLAQEVFQNPEDHILASQHLNRFSELDHIVMDDLVPEEDNEFDALEFAEQAFKGLSKWRHNPEVFVNFAGYLSSPTGMGESGRSMKAILDAAGVGHSDFELPSPVAEGPLTPSPALFGWPRPCPVATVTVANADASDSVKASLPRHYWSHVRDIGYWVWETEELPLRFQKADLNYHEIWTPSVHSAEAIRKRTKKPVHVVPHSLDFAFIDTIRPQRDKFGLPNRKILFGFMLDPRSVLARKNVLGLLESYRRGIGNRDDCQLVLKFNKFQSLTSRLSRS